MSEYSHKIKSKYKNKSIADLKLVPRIEKENGERSGRNGNTYPLPRQWVD
jgi:hypothetical protein